MWVGRIIKKVPKLDLRKIGASEVGSVCILHRVHCLSKRIMGTSRHTHIGWGGLDSPQVLFYLAERVNRSAVGSDAQTGG
jgi:hypothetical protein